MSNTEDRLKSFQIFHIQIFSLPYILISSWRHSFKWVQAILILADLFGESPVIFGKMFNFLKKFLLFFLDKVIVASVHSILTLSYIGYCMLPQIMHEET